ncbi:MAG: branched-chain amino acid ABC transporter permease [Rhodospirillales bacterium]
MSGYWSGVLAILCINVIFAYSVFLPAAAGQLNLGGGGFMAIGAYTAAYLNSELAYSVWVTIPAAMLLTGLVGFLIAFPILRTRGVYMVLATFAFAEIVSGIIINNEALGAATGLSVPDYLGLGILAPFAVAVVIVVMYLMSTRFGLAMRAVHDDENVATLFGVNIRLTQVACFAIGGVFAGLAGALYAHQYSFVEIQYFNVMVSIYVLLYVLIGGTQTPYGPLFGAVFFTLLPELMRVGATWRYVIFGVFLVVIMIVRPEGVVTRTLLDRLSFRRAAKAGAP